MGFDIGKFVKSNVDSMAHSFDFDSHGNHNSNKSIGHAFKDIGNGIGNTVSDVYHDATSAVSYTGKHLIGDVDSIGTIAIFPQKAVNFCSMYT